MFPFDGREIKKQTTFGLILAVLGMLIAFGFFNFINTNQIEKNLGLGIQSVGLLLALIGLVYIITARRG